MTTAKHTIDSDQRKANVRTALVFASIAATFFVGIIVAHAFGGPVIGVAVVGFVVLLFLVLAIGRNLRVSKGDDSQGPKGASPSDRGGRPSEAIDSKDGAEAAG